MSGHLFSRTRFVAVLMPIVLMGLLFCGCTNQAPAPSSVASPASTSTSVDASQRLVSFKFEAPLQLKSPAGPVAVEAPGYASPCWADIDDDGNKDLLVGQFNGGKIRVFKNLGDMELADGEWLMASGKVAEVPGVW